MCSWLRAFDGEGGLEAVSQSYNKFGLHIKESGDIVYREWAPSAQALSLVSLTALERFGLWHESSLDDFEE